MKLPLALPALVATYCFSSGALAAGADFCQQYAQKAVEQYNLMTSHPQCKVADDLRWQGSYDNHYKGCQMAPEFVLRSEQATRQKHLDACGGNAPASDAAAPAQGTAASAAQSSPTTPTVTPTTATTTTTTTTTPTTTDGAGAASPAQAKNLNLTLGQCQPITNADLPESQFANNRVLGKGVLLQFGGNQAVFQEFWNGKKVTSTYQVTRPHFFTVKCHGFPPGSASGHWVATRPDGPPRLLNIAGYSVTGYGSGDWWEISNDFAQQLIHGTTPPTAPAEHAPAPAKAKSTTTPATKPPGK